MNGLYYHPNTLVFIVIIFFIDYRNGLDNPKSLCLLVNFNPMTLNCTKYTLWLALMIVSASMRSLVIFSFFFFWFSLFYVGAFDLISISFKRTFIIEYLIKLKSIVFAIKLMKFNGVQYNIEVLNGRQRLIRINDRINGK